MSANWRRPRRWRRSLWSARRASRPGVEKADEAITSRPKLLSAVGRVTSHAGQKKILLTLTHESATQIERLVTDVRHGLRLIQETAPRLTKPQQWLALMRCIVERILAFASKPNLGLTALATGQLRKMDSSFSISSSCR